MSEFTIVFNQHDFVEGIKALPMTLAGSKYSNKFPQNCLYNQGNGVFSADCWNLYKAYIWGQGVLPKNKGGYWYNPGRYGLGDWTGNKILSCCSDVSTDFDPAKMVPGEWLMTGDGGHAGVYVGNFIWNGHEYNVVEATPIWANGIQATWVDSDGTRRQCKEGSKSSKWAKHGKLPWIDYSQPKPEPTYETYTSKAGDTLSSIAAVYGTTCSKLEELNPNYLQPGTVLKVKEIKPAPTPEPVHVGSIVMVRKYAKTYNGKNLANFVYDRPHDVIELNGDRAVISYNGTVVAAMHVSDLIPV